MHSRRAIRPAYTLIELVLATGSSAILMGGLASALYMSTQALVPDATATDEDNRSSLALAQATSDLRLALTFSERTAQAVTFSVPDRNNDGQTETIRYSWTGAAGNPMLYQYNGATAVSIADNVQQFNVSALTRTIPADPLPVLPVSVKYESFAEVKATTGVALLTVPRPSGVVSGDLLVAAVAIRNPTAATTVAAPAGWTLVARLTDGVAVTGAVWWKLAGASEPASYNLTWVATGQAYGWVMRFSGADATSPIHAWTTNTGASSSPSCLAVTTSVNNTMAVRIGAFDDDDVSNNNAGMSGYSTITMDYSSGSGTRCSGGAARRMLPAAGTSGVSTFSLTGSEEWVTFTLVIAPEDGL